MPSHLRLKCNAEISDIHIRPDRLGLYHRGIHLHFFRDNKIAFLSDWIAEYAKTDRSKCRHCKAKIDKGALRIGK